MSAVSAIEQSDEAVYWPLTKHKSSTIRAQTCQWLGQGRSIGSLEALRRVLLKDRSPLVRGYAVLALREMALSGRAQNRDDIIDLLEERYTADSSEWVRTVILEGLIRLGFLSLFPELEACLFHSEYRVRLMTAAALGVLPRAYPELYPRAMELLNRAAQREKHPLVREKIRSLCHPDAIGCLGNIQEGKKGLSYITEAPECERSPD